MIPQDYSEMMPQDHVEADVDVDSNVDDEVLEGLMAAQRYEKSRPRLSSAAQQDMLDESFPRLPDGDDAERQATEGECVRIRASMHDEVSKKEARSIANLREQLTEYHSLLDKLNSVTEKCNALEKTCQERGSRIQELEREVEALKRGHQSAGCGLDTNSHSHREQISFQAPFLPIVQEISNLPNPCHPSSPSAHQHQALSPFDGQFHDIYQPSMEPFARAPSPLWHISPGPSPPMSPVPSDWSIDPIATSTGYYSPQGVDCNAEHEHNHCNTEYEQGDDSLDVCLKRKASCEYDTCSPSSSGTMPCRQQDLKRLKGFAFSIPKSVDAFQSSSKSHLCVLDTNQELISTSSHLS